LQRVIFVRMPGGRMPSDRMPGGSAAFHGPLINPSVVWAADEQMELWDDCFSFPQLMVKVRRAVRIRVAYTDLAGRSQSLEAEGDFSELLQHEIDHLDGILAVQRAISPHAFATRAEWERQLNR
ncbi:MAG: peptide deformylase, partial [Anaerolineae bacterium]